MWIFLFLPIIISSTCFAQIFDDLKKDNAVIVRTRPGNNATLECPLTEPTKRGVKWFMARRSRYIGMVRNNMMELNDDFNGTLILRKDGTLLIKRAERNMVEEYECEVQNGLNATSGFVLFRLDYSHFYDGPLFQTLFWGSCMVSLISCIASFVLNVIWIIIRQICLWWINRSERISRVRTMVEAMEKYRQRQMDSLHDNYQKKVQTIRDNYHNQVEDIRQSYARQADRFRDYRQAQLDSMTQHLDNIRDNYNQQLGRIREYGSRRAEQLVESYEKQVNRMRTFTLQHRLKLMRQYKVKQQYINRLLENIANSDNSQVITENEQKIRAVLDLPQSEIPSRPSFPQRGLPDNDLQRSASFYSLPEFVIEDDDVHIRSFRQQHPVKFKQENNESNQESQPSTSGTKSVVELHNVDVKVEDLISDAQPDAPLLGHYRRKSSAKRSMSRDPDSYSTNSQ